MSAKELDFETALSQLEEIISRLEDGQIPLEEALDMFAAGIKLSKFCNQRLDAAEEKVKLLYAGPDGKPVLEDAKLSSPEGNE